MLKHGEPRGSTTHGRRPGPSEPPRLPSSGAGYNTPMRFIIKGKRMTNADSGGVVLMPKRITLGNLLSVVATVIMGALVFGGVWALLGYRVTHLEDSMEKIPTTYATQADLKLVQDAAKQLAADQKDASHDVRDGLSKLADKTAATNETIAGLASTITAMQLTMTEIRRTLEDRRRVQPTDPSP